MSTEQPGPEFQGETSGTAGKPLTSQEWLERWMAEERAAKRGSTWRVSHMMWLVAAAALFFWIVVQVGALAVLGGLVMLFAISIGAGVILARRRTTQQDSLLWILAIAAEAKMPLAPTVAAFADQYGGKYRSRIMNLASELDYGRSLPEALESVRRVVSRDALLMARVGEQTGRLSEALRLTASSRSSQLPIWTAISMRLAYLLTLLLVMQSITGFILYFIVPKFESIFKDFGLPLPMMTIWLIEGSHFMIKYGFIWAWLAPLEVLLLIFLPFSFAGWVNYDVPFFDHFLKRHHAALTMRALALVVEVGKPIELGLTTLASHYPTLWVRRKLIKVDDHVQHGEPWIDALYRQGIITHSDAQVLASASEVGNLAWALRELSETSERRLAFRFQTVIQTLFPLVVLGLGLFIGFIAVAFFLPLVHLLWRLSG